MATKKICDRCEFIIPFGQKHSEVTLATLGTGYGSGDTRHVDLCSECTAAVIKFIEVVKVVKK